MGKHVFGSLYRLKEERAYTDKDFLLDLALRAAKEAGATVVDARAWEIGGEKGGISVLVLVEESHIAIHTWREYAYATVDVYTCGEHTDPWRAWEVIVQTLKPEKTVVNYADRSQL